MDFEQRASWCIAQAEEIEKKAEEPQDPHLWDSDRMAAALWRHLADTQYAQMTSFGSMRNDR